MRRAAKVDANQAEIVAALRKVGCTVQPLHQVGGGCPDLLCARFGRNLLMEVKDGSKPPSERRLTPLQERWLRDWRGPVVVVTSVSEALQAVAVMDRSIDT